LDTIETLPGGGNCISGAGEKVRCDESGTETEPVGLKAVGLVLHKIG
jgi:hypothetical protein